MLSLALQLDHLYGLLLTFGLALVIEYLPYWRVRLPTACRNPLQGGQNSAMFANGRAWVIGFSLVICFATWFVIGAPSSVRICARPPKPDALRGAFGINVPRMITLTWLLLPSPALRGRHGRANVSPQMGSDLIIVVSRWWSLGMGSGAI